MDQSLDMDKSSPELVTRGLGVSPVAEMASLQPCDKQQMTEEFNLQRAKMKELFLQKEEEVKRVTREKQQLEGELTGLRQQLEQLQTLSENQRSEIDTLQFLVQETVEASSSESGEVRQLQVRCTELEQQLNLLSKQAQASQTCAIAKELSELGPMDRHKDKMIKIWRDVAQEVSLAPSVLVQAVTKSIARKLGADPDRPDNLEDSMKKAQEDTEMLRSLVVPLEEEIKALKDKLRDTDTQLQLAMQNNKQSTKSGDNKESGGGAPCPMCANYESQLVAEQGKCAEERTNARNAQLALKMATEELEQTTSMQAETVSSWQAEREQTAQQLASLRERVDSAERALHEARAAVASGDQSTLQRLTDLTVHRETLQERLDTLERENATLAGRYARRARDMQAEEISLPEGAAELQEYALRTREELIVACVARDAAADAEQSLRSEMLVQGGLMREQIQRHQTLAAHYEKLRERMEAMESERQRWATLEEQLKASEARLQQTTAEKTKLSEQVAELRARVSSLQTDLDNNEKVQQDFVRLSQSLQVQLERIREAESEVRWQHDEDVSECTACHHHLPPNKKKSHCRHCGRIFCGACLAHTVLSGPRKAPSHVCNVCHTLLERDTRPYFSTEAPHTPD